ncbi:SHOCT domain-containing protein [Streptomyces sp. NPDC088727]
MINQLERLGELKKQGVLTDAEFAAQKNRLLAE